MIKEYLNKMRPTDEHSLVSRLHHKALEELIPLNATIELSTKCNFRCQHCYNFDRSGPAPEGRKTGPEQVKSFMRSLKKLGGLYLAFTGGEVLLAPNLLEYVREAKTLGFYIRLKSNASLLTPALAKHLYEAGVSEMDISLYGGTARSHDLFTRTQGLFEKTLRGIQVAKQAGLSPNVNFILHRENYQEFLQMKELCEDMDVEFSMSLDMSARHDGSEDNLDWRVPPQEIGKLFSDPEMDFISKDKKATDNIQCGCARYNCAMAENGDIYPCIGAPLVAGNIFEQDFEEVWKDSPVFNKIRGLSKQDYEKCSDCGLKSYCPRNSGTAYLNTGSYTGADPWACATAEELKTLCEI